MSIYDVVKSSRGLEKVYDRNAYKYAVATAPLKVDPFVKKALKLWSPSWSESIKGYTKAPVLSEALNSVAKFGDQFAGDPLFTEKEQKCFDYALKRTRQTFCANKSLTRYYLQDSAAECVNDSAAGFSFPGQKKDECVEEAYTIARYMQHQIRLGYRVYTPPCKLAMRGHLREVESEKTRPIWVEPFEVTMMEGVWAIPYIKHLEKHVDAVHFGEDAMPRLAKRLSSLRADEMEVTLDWSGFDTSIPNFLIDHAFDIVWDSFRTNEEVKDGVPTYVTDYKESGMDRQFEYLRNYFKRTKLMLPDGSVIRKKHGIPSGSMFTQIIGSIVNYLVVTFLTSMAGVKCYDFKVLGDDSSFKTSSLDFKRLGKHEFTAIVRRLASRHFGMTLKPEKLRFAFAQDERGFLGYEYKHGTFTRSTGQWFKTAVYTERMCDTLPKSASRMLAYYILGGVADLEFSQFFRFYFKCYPQVYRVNLPVDKGVGRLMKYVLRKQFVGFNPSHLTEFGSALCLGFKTSPFRKAKVK